MTRSVKKSKDLRPGQPAKPNNLSPNASAAWDRYAGELEASGILLTPAHRKFLSMASTLDADMVACWEAIEADGPFIAGKAGLVAHPATKRLDSLRRDLIKTLTMLGLRTAVPTEAAPTERSLDDELDD